MAAAYLVQIDPEKLGGRYLKSGASAVVVYADSPADARAMAKGSEDGGPSGPWDNADVTEIMAGADMSDSMFSLVLQVLDAPTLVDVKAEGGVSGVVSVAVNAGGTGYSVNDLVTLVGGTSSRAATFRVTSESGGVVDGIELVDPGEYSVDSGLTGEATAGGNGDLTVDVTYATDAYENFMAEAVGLLNADAQIAGASLDLGASPPLLTLANVADNLGDKKVAAEFRFGQDAVPSLLSTVTDQGAAAAALTVELPASPTIPSLVAQLRP